MKVKRLFRVIQESRLIGIKLRRYLLKCGGYDIGRNTIIRGLCYFNGESIKIGEDCFINNFCKFYSHRGNSSLIELESNVVVAMNVTFCTHTHDIQDEERRASLHTVTKPIKICRGTWIGANTIILPGVTIGEGCVIAAGSVVTSD